MLHNVTQAQSLAVINNFSNDEFGKVRVILRNGEPWFVAKDVADCLGYTNHKKAVRDDCRHTVLLKGNESLPLDFPAQGMLITPGARHTKQGLGEPIPAL